MNTNLHLLANPYYHKKKKTFKTNIDDELLLLMQKKFPNCKITKDDYQKNIIKIENMFIENSGQVIAQFTNGDTRTIAQLAMATFKNPTGLEKAGGNSYLETASSGNVTIDSALNSNSSIVSGALEMSNVDLANEFTDMIVSQRGFQASTKVVSTTDQILEEAINLKR